MPFFVVVNFVDYFATVLSICMENVIDINEINKKNKYFLHNDIIRNVFNILTPKDLLD